MIKEDSFCSRVPIGLRKIKNRGWVDSRKYNQLGYVNWGVEPGPFDKKVSKKTFEDMYAYMNGCNGLWYGSNRRNKTLDFICEKPKL